VTANELRAEMAIEFGALQQVVQELDALRQDLAGRAPTERKKTSAAAFLAQFYGGIENILKRLSRYHAVELPLGDNWHFDLFKSFCPPENRRCPSCSTRRWPVNLGHSGVFRHVVHHGYGFQIEWDRMSKGVEQVGPVLAAIRQRVEAHLEAL